VRISRRVTLFPPSRVQILTTWSKRIPNSQPYCRQSDMKRMGRPEEIAKTVDPLSGGTPPSSTGAEIVGDGGDARVRNRDWRPGFTSAALDTNQLKQSAMTAMRLFRPNPPPPPHSQSWRQRQTREALDRYCWRLCTKLPLDDRGTLTWTEGIGGDARRRLKVEDTSSATRKLWISPLRPIVMMWVAHVPDPRCSDCRKIPYRVDLAMGGAN